MKNKKTDVGEELICVKDLIRGSCSQLRRNGCRRLDIKR